MEQEKQLSAIEDVAIIRKLAFLFIPAGDLSVKEEGCVIYRFNVI